MAFDAFISYSSKDKAAADAVCAMLEQTGIRAWIAPRDIRPGIEYGAAIIEAIDRCRVMVLIFSSHANTSGQILREVERAVSKGIPIVPVRIEGVLPTKSMEYFLGTIHWLDALTPPLESHLRQLVETVRAILASARGEPTVAAPPNWPAPPPAVHARRTGQTAVFAALGATAIALLAGAVWFYQGRPIAIAPPPLVEALVPEAVPFITDRDRATIRSEYLSAPDHKAIAIGARIGFVTGQASVEAAKNGALAACQRISEKDPKKCELYAVGNAVVLATGQPPMPPVPWLVRNPAVEQPFAADRVPLVAPSVRPAMERYSAAKKPKAVAVSSRGFAQFNDQGSVDEAVRRSLEFCGSYSSIACLVVAIDDAFVVAIPVSMKPIGLFRAATEASIAPDARGTVARRLANATGGWTAVAVGAAGRPGLNLGATNERVAIDGALAACRKLDQNCRVIAIGPFLVASANGGN